MEDMKKDERLEQEFRAYFDGAEAPRCDLSAAKEALGARRAQKRRRWMAFASACACALLIGTVTAGAVFAGTLHGGAPAGPSAVPPDGAEPVGTRVTYASLAAEYGAIRGLAPFEWADNAQADYTLYTAEDGSPLRVEVRLRYLHGFSHWEAEAYVDLSGGTYSLPQAERYASLEERGDALGHAYTYAQRTAENGETVYDAQLLGENVCCVTLTSRDVSDLSFLMRLLAAGA